MTEASRKKPARAPAPLHARPLRLWQDNSVAQDVRVEVIPLIDVIFCILTFFILAAVGFSRQQAISLNLPKASTGTPQMREMLVVGLDDLGQVYVEQQVVTRNQLYQALKNYHQLSPDGLMVLHASRNSSYNEVVQVLDMLREVGGNRIALATLPSAESPEDSNSDLDKNYLSPYGTQIPGGSINPIQPNYPPNSSQGLGNPLNSYPSVPPAPPVPDSGSQTPSN